MKPEILVLGARIQDLDVFKANYSMHPVSSVSEANQALQQKKWILVMLVADKRSDRIKYAREICHLYRQNVLLMVESSQLDVAIYQLQDEPVFVLDKRSPLYVLDEVLAFLVKNVQEKDRLQKQIDQQQKRLLQEQSISRAKLLLIEKMHYSEDQAHRYITKKAMDLSMTKADVARLLIKRLEN